MPRVSRFGGALYLIVIVRGIFGVVFGRDGLIVWAMQRLLVDNPASFLSLS